MIHEVMVLDHSGPALGVIVYGASVKLFLFTALVLGALLPFTGDAWTDWVLFVGAAIGTAVLLGAVESTMARLRLLTVPKLLVSATLLTAFAIVFQLHR
jgi:formate hydrogenlyase subunit 4